MKSFGIDIGRKNFKAVWLEENKVKDFFIKPHQGKIKEVWQEVKEKWQIKERKEKIAVTGYFRQVLDFPSLPERVAQEKTLDFLFPEKEITLLKLGAGGFSVLKTRIGKSSEYRQNPRCAAEAGSFLEQILSRVGLKIFQVDQLTEKAKGLEITSRCGVTIKSDFTHLLNQGNPINEVVAGLLDSLAKNAISLILKSPPTKKILVIGGLSDCQRIIQKIQKSFNNLEVKVPPQSLFFEALGTALIASENKLTKIKLKTDSSLVFLPGFKNLDWVKKIQTPEIKNLIFENLILGLDIGSTGSKLVVFEKVPIFEIYCETKGNPVQAAKNLIEKIPVEFLKKIKSVGCTGSGREIVAGLLRASLPRENQNQIFVFNEIAAHAQGALYYDKSVDTVVDIGGQDAKFIKIEQGRVIDQAMNTVCSAGTGSFLAEQLQLLGVSDIKELGKTALESPRAIDLGQHCAIFVSEQIDEAQRKNAKLEEIAAGLYYSIVRNYNNRVKGMREYGQKIFLQGKPAENLALATALAKISGKEIIVPPSPGIMGALGIAILTEKEIGSLKERPVLNFEKFLKTKIISKKEFKCQSKEGCQTGNQCLIEVIEIEIENQKIKFFWGGRCDKYEKVEKKNLLLAKTIQPFLVREKLIQNLIREKEIGKKTIAIPRGLETEEILPLLIVFFQEMNFNIKLWQENSLAIIEEGAKFCQSSFCAPLQALAGQAKKLEKENYLFLPKIIEIESQRKENRCYVCPLSQAMPDMFEPKLKGKILRPFLNFKEGYEKNEKEFLKMVLKLKSRLWKFPQAFKKAVKAQKEFEEKLKEVGKEVLDIGRKNQIPIIVILGHPYIINSPLFNAAIPETIFEKGAIALPAECYPLEGKAPKLNNIYWGYGQRLLEIAYEARRKENIFPLWLSVYSCGPDSFLTHFFQYLSSGKPYCLLESDAYTGQAGFKTRIEAFLYSVKNYQSKKERKIPNLAKFEIKSEIFKQVEKRKILIPWMGEGSILASALLKCFSIEAEYLPMADQEALELGRQVTSGKECLPMIVTIGNLLKYLKSHPKEKYAYFMPRAEGPCRFGQYQLLTKIILEKNGLEKKVSVISPNSETGYQLGKKFNSAIQAKAWAVFVLVDLLRDALYQIRPIEKIPGQGEKIFNICLESARNLILKSQNDWSGYKNLWEMKKLAEFAAQEFKKIPVLKEKRPKILVTGEIFVRLDAFSNNQIIKTLEELGASVKLAPFREWINYTLWQRKKKLTTTKQKAWKTWLTWFVQKRIENQLYQIFAKELKWPKDESIDQILKTAKPYLSRLHPLGESALTIGLPLLLWKKKEIDGVVLVGPFECMPTRIGETQLELISEKTGLPVLSFSFHGDPLDTEALESFVWDLRKKN